LKVAQFFRDLTGQQMRVTPFWIGLDRGFDFAASRLILPRLKQLLGADQSGRRGFVVRRLLSARRQKSQTNTNKKPRINPHIIARFTKRVGREPQIEAGLHDKKRDQDDTRAQVDLELDYTKESGAPMKAGIFRRVEGEAFGWLLPVVVVLSEAAGVWRSADPLWGAWSQPEYSHAWLILPLALLVFAYRFRTVGVGNRRIPGVLVAALSVLVMLFGWAAGSYTASIYGAILGLIGFVWSSIGTKGMRKVAAPLAYLFFMVPVPLALYISTSADMQLLSSKLGIALISLFSIPASLDGNIIILPSTRLEVAEACSGLRYLFPLVSFAFLVAMMLEDRFWKKTLIVLSSIPIAIVMNAGRIAMIAVLLDRFGIDTSSGSAHAFEGFVVFFLCLVILLIEVRFLLGIGGSRGRFVASDLLALDRGRIGQLLNWPTSRTSLLAATIVLAGTSLVASLPARIERVPERLPFALFPMAFGDWRGVPKTLDSESLNALGLTDYVLADYTDDRNRTGPVNFYIAYYASQRAGIHAHSPQLCIPGGGWSIISQSVAPMQLGNGAPVKINRVIIEKRGVRQVVYYWFEERGRHIASESSLKYYALRDALFENRSDGALVRVVVPLNAENGETTADSTAERLVAGTGPFLQAYVPGRTSRGTGRAVQD
jgi:exosortase D (VPLPA-CTERM-specific)